MKTTLLAFTCAFGAAACASDHPPAQVPSSASSTQMSPPPTSSTPVGATNAMPPTSAPSTTDSAPTTDSTAPAGGAPMSPGASTGATNPGGSDQYGNADNTNRNKSDRGATLTPMDQGNSKAEIAITAAIRRGMMSDSTLSTTAKNVKVITVGTRVTLRGPVKSDAERATIENLARQTSGVTDVDDQLEVKR